MSACPNCRAALPLKGFTCRSCGADVAVWIGREGQVLGPYTESDVRQAYAEGRAGRDDVVMVGNQGQWVPVATFLEGGPPVSPPPLYPAPPVTWPTAPAPPAGIGAPAIAVVLVIVGLFVLIVIGGAAAVLFPVFARSREKALQTSCLSNVKQLSLGLLMYCQDWDERFPRAPAVMETGPGGIAPGAGPRGFDLPLPYRADNWRMFIYPYIKNEQVLICPKTQRRNSYELNAGLYGVELKRVTQPAMLVGIYETGLLEGFPAPPHSGGFNTGFVDGHCKWVKDKSTVATRP